MGAVIIIMNGRRWLGEGQRETGISCIVSVSSIIIIEGSSNQLRASKFILRADIVKAGGWGSGDGVDAYDSMRSGQEERSVIQKPTRYHLNRLNQLVLQLPPRPVALSTSRLCHTYTFPSFDAQANAPKSLRKPAARNLDLDLSLLIAFSLFRCTKTPSSLPASGPSYTRSLVRWKVMIG